MFPKEEGKLWNRFKGWRLEGKKVDRYWISENMLEIIRKK